MAIQHTFFEPLRQVQVRGYQRAFHLWQPNWPHYPQRAQSWIASAQGTLPIHGINRPVRDIYDR